MDDDSTELGALIVLTMTPGVGPRTARAILARFGTAGRALRASSSTLREVEGIGPKLADQIMRGARENDGERILERCRLLGVDPVPFGNARYPQPLNDIPDPPAILYIKGSYEPVDPLAVAIVGARSCTPYGLRVAERLGASLARVGLTVVSGLARGIDAAAHRGALKAGGRTIGVLANGLGSIYPPEHDKLADEIAAKGAVVSEMALDQGPLAGLFPQRNRIISGLCLGVIVVEATPRSGSLSTAAHAVEQNREVFAVPGPVDSISSRGCHALIRDGARLVETIEDVLEELGPLTRPIKAEAESPPIRHPAELKLSENERSLLGQLSDVPVGIDELISRTGMTPSQTMATLSVLEMRRLVRRAPGNQFSRI
jgi:DNA processing protein